MQKRYAELDRIHHDLLTRSEGDARSDLELLRSVTLHVRIFREPLVTQLIARLSSRLQQSPSNPLVRQLCRGALSYALDAGANAREVLATALQLVRRASVASQTAFGVPLSQPDKTRAAELLLSYSAAPAKYDALTRGVREFVQQNDAIAGGVLFARFIADLEFLAAIVESQACTAEQRQTAAGALTYFVEAHDAIDDNLGIAGLLDDAYVAQLAAERIDPTRRAKTVFVDSLLTQWPFLSQLRLEMDGREWLPSEFVLLNLASGFGPNSAQRTAIVLPATRELPLLLGVLAAFGTLHDSLSRDRVCYRPSVGDYVCVGGNAAEIAEVVAYLTRPGEGAVDPRDARFVVLRYLPRTRKGGAAPVKHTKSIDILDGCVPAPGVRTARRTSVPESASSLPIGPLERLFALDGPVRIDALKLRLVVVAPLGRSRELLSTTRLHGRPLVDLLPCGRVSADDNFSTEWWSNARSIDTPVLTIARDLSEAAAVLARRPENSCVIAPIGNEERSSASLKELENARLLALVPHRCGEVQENLERAGFRFLDWTPELERTLSHRPRKAIRNPIDILENRLRQELRAEIHLHQVHSDSVESAFASLRELSQAVREEFGEEAPDSLATWAALATGTTFDVSAEPLVLQDTTGQALDARVSQLRTSLHGSGPLWSDRCRVSAEQCLEQLTRAVSELRRSNPKADAVRDLVGNGSIRVRCSDRRWTQLRSVLPRSVRWTRSDAALYRPVALFEWRGRERMELQLFPPLGSPTHIIFYAWESERLRALQHARQTKLTSHWRTGVRHAAWHTAEPVTARSDAAHAPPEPPPEPIEDWALGLRRQHVIARAKSSPQVGLVEAVPVYFSESRYGLYQPTSSVLVATHLLRAVKAEDAALRERTVAELRVGDVVVIVRGSAKDAIRAVADSRLPPGARDLARAWQMPLQELRAALGSDRGVCAALRAAGCEKADSTIIWWMRSTTQIGPNHESDIDAIARATRSSELSKRLSACKSAIHQVRGEHLRASNDLATRAIAALEARLARGEELDSTIAIGDSVELLTVEGIDHATIRVPSTATGIVQELQ